MLKRIDLSLKPVVLTAIVSIISLGFGEIVVADPGSPACRQTRAWADQVVRYLRASADADDSREYLRTTVASIFGIFVPRCGHVRSRNKT
jgi:hypothetical protein